MAGEFSYKVEGPIPDPLMKAAKKGKEHVVRAFVEEYSFAAKPLIKREQEESEEGQWLFFSKLTPIIAYEFHLNFTKNLLYFRLVLINKELVLIMKTAEEVFYQELSAAMAAAAKNAGIGTGKKRDIYV